MATPAGACNGQGTCVVGSVTPCAPYVCNTAGTACFSSCTADAQCLPPNACSGNMCGKKPLGGRCTLGIECQSGNCIEGFCCDTACGDVCKSCAVAGQVGTCVNVPAGVVDPMARCVATAESTCDEDGFCDGAGACRQWGPSTQCRAESCPAGSANKTLPAFCDGNGNCPAVQTQPCAPYACDQLANQCHMSCTTNAQCSVGVCDDMMSCGLKAAGASCTVGTECGSGNCVDLTCCTSATCGTCQSCANAQGTCANVPDEGTDPDTCTDETGSNACGTTGKCDGVGACKLRASGTMCGTMCVMSNTEVQGRECNGSGECTAAGGAPMPCAPFLCASGACLTTCSGDEQCASGKVCLGGICQDPPPPPDPPPSDGGA